MPWKVVVAWRRATMVRDSLWLGRRVDSRTRDDRTVKRIGIMKVDTPMIHAFFPDLETMEISIFTPTRKRKNTQPKVEIVSSFCRLLYGNTMFFTVADWLSTDGPTNIPPCQRQIELTHCD